MISPGVLNWRAYFFQIIVFIGLITPKHLWLGSSPCDGHLLVQFLSNFQELVYCLSNNSASMVRFQPWKKASTCSCGEHLLGLALSWWARKSTPDRFLPMFWPVQPLEYEQSRQGILVELASSRQNLYELLCFFDFLDFLQLLQVSIFQRTKAGQLPLSSEIAVTLARLVSNQDLKEEGQFSSVFAFEDAKLWIFPPLR